MFNDTGRGGTYILNKILKGFLGNVIVFAMLTTSSIYANQIPEQLIDTQAYSETGDALANNDIGLGSTKLSYSDILINVESFLQAQNSGTSISIRIIDENGSSDFRTITEEDFPLNLFELFPDYFKTKLQ